MTASLMCTLKSYERNYNLTVSKRYVVLVIDWRDNNLMKRFPNMFIQIFSVLLVITLLIHLFVFLIFPKPYIENRKDEIHAKADEISANLNGQSLNYVEES